MSKGRLTFIGLGLYDEKDISLKGIEDIKNCDKVYAEFYTAKLTGTVTNKIEKTIGKTVEVLSREETEKGKKILEFAKDKNVVFLTCGDPMTATTHVDIRLRAIKMGIKTRIIHGGSIITAVPGLLGLQNYKFGRTTTLVATQTEKKNLCRFWTQKRNLNRCRTSQGSSISILRPKRRPRTWEGGIIRTS